MAETSTNFNYDVFISYSHQDAAWVQSQLLPQLETAGLRVCIDFRDFYLGSSLISEMEKAITQSRATLLVLSPSYLSSQWTHFENILSQTLDPTTRQKRVIPIMYQQCELPLRIRAMTYVDFTHPEQTAFQFKRLLAGVGVKEALPSASPPKFTPQSQIRDYNLAALRHLLIAALSDEELLEFCFDNFPAVYREFTIAMSKNRKIQLLIEYCERHLEIDRLLTKIKESNSAQYARFEQRLQVEK